MPTRNQSEFERCLVEALRSNNIANAIGEAIISIVTKKLAEKFNYYDAKIASLEAEIQLIKTSAMEGCQKSDDKKLEHKIDSLQQQTKNNSIRLMGIKETPNENVLSKATEIFRSKLQIDILETDILAAYRVGQDSNRGPRHVLVKLRSNTLKSNIYNKKRMLKGTGIIVKEDLTMIRLSKVKEASEKYGFRNVWTFNGNIFAKTDKGVEKILYNIH
nr:unnamed protein product [Callosobruchus chinensis]